MGGRRPAGWNLGQGCLEASAVPTQHVETRARGMGFLRQPGGWGPGEGQRLPGSLGTLGDPGAKTFHSVPRPMHEPQTCGGSPGTQRASSRGTGWGPQGVGRRQAGVRRAGQTPAQHSTQQARPPTAGQGPLPLARPLEPGAPCLLLHLGFSCFKDKSFRTWREVLAQGLDLRGHVVPGCPWHFLHMLTTQLFMSFSHCPLITSWR